MRNVRNELIHIKIGFGPFMEQADEHGALISREFKRQGLMTPLPNPGKAA